MTPTAGNNDGEAFQTAVFIATSLDTHLVTMVSASDTVSGFKKKIMSEHRQCFPAIGNIKIHCLKVKRREVFYHLSDSMLVKNAFGTTKGNWFMSVDASSIEQDINIQHIDKCKDGDRLALPWETHNGSINKNVDGGSCKDVSKNLKEDMSSDDKQLVINKEINAKKKAHDVSNDNLLDDPSECGLSVKKKRKTQRLKSNVKASEENMIVTYDNNKSKDKDLIGENTRINDDEKHYDLDQVSAVAPSSLEGVERETAADVAMVAEKNNQHEMSEKEKENEPVQKAAMGNEIPSSLMKTSDCERDAAGLTVVGPVKGGSKSSTKHKAAEEEVASTSFIIKLQNINKDAIDSSQQAVGSNGQDSRGVLIYKHMEDVEFPLKQGPEVKLTERRKKVKKSAAKAKKETRMMHADDNLVGDISSTVYAPILDEKVIGEKNEVLEPTLVDDSNKNVEMIVKEIEVSEHMEEKSKNKLKDIVGSRKRKKDVEKTVLKNEESAVKQSNDVATPIDASHVDCVRNDDILMKNGVGLLATEKKFREVKVESIDDISEKQNDTMDSIKKNTRKKKTKKYVDEVEKKDIVGIRKRKKDVEKTALKNDESVVKQSGDVAISVDALHVDCVRNDDMLMNNDVESFGTEIKLREVKVENSDDISEKQNEKTGGIKKNTRKKKTKESASRNEDESITKCINSEIFINVTKGDSNLPDGGREGEQQLYDGLTGKGKKKNKSSLAGPQDRLSKLRSTEPELESKKSQSVHHHQLLEDTSKNVTGSEVSKVNNEVCITNDGSSEINFMDHFAPGHQSKKAKDDSRNDGAIWSQKIISNNENNKAVTDPNIANTDQLKTPKPTRNIDDESSSSSKSFGRSYHHQKSNKQQSVVGPVKKNLPAVNSLLNTPGNIFGDDESDRSSADDNAAVNSDSSTRTPSRKLTSSSGESDSSIDSRRNRSFAVKRKGGGKVSRTSENKSKKVSMADLLRSSSRFKKAKFTASQQVDDTESQPVDFVPDSQPLS